MKAQNKKAEMNWQIVKIVIAALFLVGLSFIFIPELSNFGGWIEQNIGFNFGTQEIITTETIDEERIDAWTQISVESVSSDSKSGYLVIIKQQYGGGWNLETFSSQAAVRNRAGEIMTPAQTSYTTLVANKKLAEILSNSDTALRGAITANGKTYIHAVDLTDTDPSTPDFMWYYDINSNQQYDSTDTKIEPDALAQLIVADLFNKAGGTIS